MTTATVLTFEDFTCAIMEGLDGIDYKTAKRLHKALYPEAKVRALRNGDISVTFPDEPDARPSDPDQGLGGVDVG